MIGTLPMSAPVRIARTPGWRDASPVAMPRIVPWARGLRTKAACHWPVRETSSMNVPRPRRKRRSSVRSIGAPT